MYSCLGFIEFADVVSVASATIHRQKYQNKDLFTLTFYEKL